MQRLLGEAFAQLGRARRIPWVDLLLVVGLAGLLFTFIDIGREWTGVHRPSVAIDLSPAALPRYTLFSLFRGLFAYVISLGLTIVYGYWAAKDRVAGRLLIPLLDILQSIPVLGFMPGLVLAMVALFPHTNLGLELAAVIMIFTGQAWNMTFSFYHSLKSVPHDIAEASTAYRFDWWRRFKWVELPFGATGLVWSSMMSMAGGWFFLMINEAFRLGDHDFRLPGLGSYMSVAVAEGRTDAMAMAVLAMVLVIVGLDQLLWRPVVVWAQRFRVEETAAAEASRSWFLDLLRRSVVIRRLGRWRKARARRRRAAPAAPARAVPRGIVEPAAALAAVALWSLLALLAWGGLRLLHLLAHLPAAYWAALGAAGLATLARVLVST